MALWAIGTGRERGNEGIGNLREPKINGGVWLIYLRHFYGCLRTHKNGGEYLHTRRQPLSFLLRGKGGACARSVREVTQMLIRCQQVVFSVSNLIFVILSLR